MWCRLLEPVTCNLYPCQLLGQPALLSLWEHPEGISRVITGGLETSTFHLLGFHEMYCHSHGSQILLDQIPVVSMKWDVRCRARLSQTSLYIMAKPLVQGNWYLGSMGFWCCIKTFCVTVVTLTISLANGSFGRGEWSLHHGLFCCSRLWRLHFLDCSMQFYIVRQLFFKPYFQFTCLKFKPKPSLIKPVFYFFLTNQLLDNSHTPISLQAVASYWSCEQGEGLFDFWFPCEGERQVRVKRGQTLTGKADKLAALQKKSCERKQRPVLLALLMLALCICVILKCAYIFSLSAHFI